MSTILAGVSVGAVTRFVVQPRWLAWHLLLVVVLVSFTWLGRWQLGAFEHKADHGVAAGDRRTVALDTLSRPGGRLADGDVGRRVRVSGSYVADSTLLVPGRAEPGGGRTGYLVVTPVRTGDGILPVVRGWVRGSSDAATEPPLGPIEVTGLLQRSETGPPEGRSAGTRPGQLPYVATVTVLDALPYPAAELYDGYLALRSEQPGRTAAASPVQVAAQDVSSGGVGRWRNLAYALQWWLFAAAAVFFWFVVLRRAVQ
jgi:cytochrome oxidase assembly protein ShyY1